MEDARRSAQRPVIVHSGQWCCNDWLKPVSTPAPSAPNSPNDTASGCPSADAGNAGTTPSPNRSSPPSKTELVHRRAWPTRTTVRKAIFEYIEGWYNTHRRRHSSLGYQSPTAYETSRIEPPLGKVA
ncbi:IS3 family transposase [Dactylosporangium sp. NPDC051485]|uniref:IS3 family transposase n=1 Tax=Dactylosporangium sp. NPDC051485 TaxID=3154846 RepID=UPI00342208D0